MALTLSLLALAAALAAVVHFAVLMALPWLAAIAVEWVAIRWFFAIELERTRSDDPPVVEPESPGAWRRAIRAEAGELTLAEFTQLGLLTVPVGLVLCTVLVWVGVRGWG